MRFAVVIPNRWVSNDPAIFSVHIAPYMSAAQLAGHEGTVVCRDDSVFAVDFPVVTADMAKLSDQAFWRGQAIDVALLFWMGVPDVAIALRAAGSYVVLQCDSDGQFSTPTFPWTHLSTMLGGRRRFASKVRAAWHWATQYWEGLRYRDSDAAKVFTAADRVGFESTVAIEKCGRFLARLHRSDLTTKLFVLPHVVTDDITSMSINRIRNTSIICIGRWDDPQKDADLLCRVLCICLRRMPSLKVTLIGRHGEAMFGSIRRRWPSLEIKGRIPHDEVKTHLSKAKIFLSTSRWEGAPVSANEALCLGCTVIGPPIPAFISIAEEGRFGIATRTRTAEDLAEAVGRELENWNTGQRNSETIAAFWRSRLSADACFKQIYDSYASDALMPRTTDRQ